MTIEPFPVTTLGAAAAAVVDKLPGARIPDVERIAITDRKQWLALRSLDVTASAISALLGVSEYQSAYRLWAQKSGLIAEENDEPLIDDDSISLSPMGRGTLLEDVAAELLRRLKPDWLVAKCGYYYREPETRIGATPDMLVNDPARGFGIVQIKNPEPSIFRAKWRSESGEIEPPLDYVVQTNVEAHLTGAEWAAIGVLIIGHRVDFRLIPVPIHDGIMDRLRTEVAAFWHRVETNDPPPADYGADGALIAKLYGHDDSSMVDLRGNNRIGELVASREALKAREAEGNAAEKERKAIDAEIIQILGTAACGTLADGRIVEAKTVRRGAYQVKETSYRSVMVKG